MERSGAIKVLKDFWSVYEVGSEIREAFETLIPELKESENERIRNLLYCLIRDRSDNGKLLEHNGVSVDMVLAWIEKQGKPKMAANAIREGVAHYGITQYQIDNWLKKYVEVESTEPESSVLPKYGIGDVIRLKNSNHEFIISHIADGYYHSNGAFIEIRMADDVNGDWEYVRHIQPAADTTKEDALDCTIITCAISIINNNMQILFRRISNNLGTTIYPHCVFGEYFG